MPELAKKITIDRSTWTVHIDGQEFPWFVHEEGPTVEGTGRVGCPIVYIPVLTEDVEVIPATEE